MVSPNHQIWKGYNTLLVRENFSSERTELILEQAGLEFLSFSREQIDFFDYEEIRSVPLADLEIYLDPLDPRLDSYMQELPNYYKTDFQGSLWNIYYIRSGEGVDKVSAILSRIFDGENAEWILADDRLKPNQYLPYLCGVFLLCLIILAGKTWWRMIFSVLPWIGSIFAGSLPLFVASGFIALGFFYLRSQSLVLWRKHLNYSMETEKIWNELKIPIFICGVVFAFSFAWILFLKLESRYLLFLFLGTAGQISSGGMEFGFEFWNIRRHDHRLFIPVFLFKSPQKAILKRDFLIPVIPALILALTLFLPLEAELIETPVPSPVPVFSRLDNNTNGFSWDAMSMLEGNSRTGIYPDLVDYISHRAFQEVFFYGGNYTFPHPGDRVESSEIILSEGEIRSEVVIYKEFTEAWYTDILCPDTNKGVISLLLSQGVPCKIELADALIIKSSRNWKKSGFAVFTLYFTILLLFYVLKGRWNTKIRKAKAETINYIKEIKKENIA